MIDNKVEDIRKHVEAIMKTLNLEITQSNELTPLRIAKMYCNEIFKNRNNANIEELDAQMKTFEAENDNPVTVTVSFYSTCEHHFMPFYGTATVTYVPDKTIIGLSKIPRVVKFFSKKPQLQERLTTEIGEYLVKELHPKYLNVRLLAEHTCVSARGVESDCLTATCFEYDGNTDTEKNM